MNTLESLLELAATPEGKQKIRVMAAGLEAASEALGHTTTKTTKDSYLIE